jgi:hypothetical protein
MRDAFDTLRNQHVQAVDSAAGRFPDRYLCPVCQTAVFYASGDYQTPHFKHHKGDPHDECERRSTNFYRDVPLAQHSFEHLDAVLVAKQSLGAQESVVSFAVRFRPAYHTGCVEFISGKLSTLYMIHSGLRQQFFRISSPESSYLLKAQSNAGDHLQHIVKGFEENAPAVFRSTAGESVRIPEHRVLKPGEYIVVSRRPLPELPPQMEAQFVRTIVGLHAIRIQIPESPTWQVRNSIKTLLGFEVSARMAVYGFLSPANIYEIAADCWELSTDEELVIHLKMTNEGAQRYTRVLVQCRVRGRLTTSYLSWNERANALVVRLEPGIADSDLLRIGLADNSASSVLFLLEVQYSDDIASPECSRLQFHFCDSSNRHTRLKWSAHELPQALLAAVRGTTKLLEILGIPEARTIKARDATGQRQSSLPMEGAAEELLGFLRQSRFPCILSAPGHPVIRIERERKSLSFSKDKAASLIGAARSRQQARFFDAYKRGYVSPYVIQTMRP